MGASNMMGSGMLQPGMGNLMGGGMTQPGMGDMRAQQNMGSIPQGQQMPLGIGGTPVGIGGTPPVGVGGLMGGTPVGIGGTPVGIGGLMGDMRAQQNMNSFPQGQQMQPGMGNLMDSGMLQPGMGDMRAQQNMNSFPQGQQMQPVMGDMREQQNMGAFQSLTEQGTSVPRRARVTNSGGFRRPTRNRRTRSRTKR